MSTEVSYGVGNQSVERRRRLNCSLNWQYKRDVDSLAGVGQTGFCEELAKLIVLFKPSKLLLQINAFKFKIVFYFVSVHQRSTFNVDVGPTYENPKHFLQSSEQTNHSQPTTRRPK